MTILHLTDPDGIFVTAIELDPYGPVPFGAIGAPPPPLSGAEVARWRDGVWEVLATRPPNPEAPSSN